MSGGARFILQIEVPVEMPDGDVSPSVDRAVAAWLASPNRERVGRGQSARLEIEHGDFRATVRWRVISDPRWVRDPVVTAA